MTPILVVLRDRDEARRLAELLPRRTGRTVEATGSFSRTTVLLRETVFACAIVDVATAGSAGVLLIAYLRRVVPRLPLVVVSDTLEDAIRVLIADAAPEAWLTRPIEAESIVAAVEKCLATEAGETAEARAR